MLLVDFWDVFYADLYEVLERRGFVSVVWFIVVVLLGVVVFLIFGN